MYKNSEILKIFNSITTMSEFEKVVSIFLWDFDHKFTKKTPFLHAISMETFRRLIQ